MSLVSPGLLRGALLTGLINVHQHWRRLVNIIVPDPYLDEIFHIPQAQAYWAGRWAHWDDKITTPPALYAFSYIFNVARKFGGGEDDSSVEDLRFVNIILLYLLLVALYVWTYVTKKPVAAHNVLQREFNMVMFPLFFFFSGLYYTDLFSALTVVLTCSCWAASNRWGSSKFLFQVLHVVLGLVSLASRQTNIFWVGIFLAGLQIVETIKENAKNGDINDPNVDEARIEDVFTSCLSLLSSAVPIIPRLILDLWPQVALLGSFAAFVVWNGGVVLGDKTNHIATIHLPQLLYIWPFIVFFSWPALLPQFTSLARLRQRLPRAWVACLVMLLMGAAVHFNTIVHPFTLADNRHYVFYVFRILMREWWIKYASVPIYFACAWLVLNALGNNDGKGEVKGAPQKTKTVKIRRNLTENGVEDGSVSLSFVLVWLASTALSLVSAPLVEPRYFIVPWLLWRLNVPEKIETPDEKAEQTDLRDTGSILEKALHLVSAYSRWIELAWYLLVNFVTCWMFLYRGFTWPQESGKVQRFMW